MSPVLSSDLQLYDIVKGVLVSEKIMQISAVNNIFVYALKVDARSTKVLIKQFFEKILDEEVLSVRIINTAAKKKKFKGKDGKKSGFKKAIVRVANSIEMFNISA